MAENNIDQSGRDDFDRRQKQLLAFAWGATLLPLLAFAYLTWQSMALNEQNAKARTEVKDRQQQINALATEKRSIEAEIARLQKDLVAQRESTRHYRDIADVKIRFYRESDRAVVQQALTSLGFKVDATLGSSQLIDMRPNTVAFGNLVSEQDLRDIAVALVEAGFPLKRIAPAVRQPDPKLIQIYASAESEHSCGLLSVDHIRTGQTCGPK